MPETSDPVSPFQIAPVVRRAIAGLLCLLGGGAASCVLFAASTVTPAKAADNVLTPAEEQDGWRLLWDGKTTAGWRSARSGNFPDHGWIIHDGELAVAASEGKESAAGGDIITLENFSNFDLQVDFKITPGANSGIKIFVDTGLNKGSGSAIGLEYQILDDALHPDAKLGRNGNRTMASLYDLIPPDPAKPVYPIGEWNHARILSRGRHVEHWLNGRKVVEYERGSPEFRALVATSKYAKWPHFGELPEGPILLQDHGNAISFKNVKIRILPAP